MSLNSCRLITRLPDSFVQLSSLIQLDLAQCVALTSLPDSFSSLSGLCQLNLDGCSRLESHPEDFGSPPQSEWGNWLGRLIRPIVRIWPIVRLCNCFSNCGTEPKSNMCQLNLRNRSKLTGLPTSFVSLSSLQRLLMRNCPRLAHLPASFGKLSSLWHLGLNGCCILTELPASFGSLSSLVYLDLGDCRLLIGLPASFADLFCLQQLELRDCASLGSLPAGFGGLSCLQRLDLSYCNLTVLPSSFGSLNSLSLLHFGSNGGRSKGDGLLEEQIPVAIITGGCCQVAWSLHPPSWSRRCPPSFPFDVPFDDIICTDATVVIVIIEV